MLRMYIKSVGILAPGMHNWSDAVKALTQAEAYQPEPISKKLDTLLPPNERRRATRISQLALNVAQQACQSIKPDQCLQIFSSSNGDISTFHRISMAMTMPGRPVSPTLFHNSVHNAPAGYWSIATQSQTQSTSITSFRDSFSSGLLEAAVQLNADDNKDHKDCLLVSYDELPPAPFLAQTGISEAFSCALLLSPNSNQAIAQLDLSIGQGDQRISTVSIPDLEKLRQSNPQAQVLSLLEPLALDNTSTITLPYFEQGLTVSMTPLSQPGTHD